MTNDNIINKKYRLIEKIGCGSFGSIYKAENIRTKELVAIKIESIRSDTKLLKNESIIYQYLSNIKGIPSIKWYGKDSNYYYMVINLLGDSFDTLKRNKHVFSLNLTLQIGIKLITLLKTIHDLGLVHRDIKPDNFLLGPKNDSKQIYLIDFGFCKSFMNGNKHIEMKYTNSLIGSQTYASINAHDFKELSRRDDLESLGYLLLYFYLGTLKWQDIGSLNNSQNVNNVIKQMKINLLEDITIPNILLDYMKYIRSLDFDETPNYDKMIDAFTKEIANNISLV